MSENQESSVEIIGRKVSEMPERKGTVRVWTSGSSESDSSAIIGGAEEDVTLEGPATTGGGREGPATGAGIGGAVEPPMASLTCAIIAGI